jgi:hypothetical protein
VTDTVPVRIIKGKIKRYQATSSSNLYEHMNDLHQSALRIDREDHVLLLLIAVGLITVMSYFSSKKGKNLI